MIDYNKYLGQAHYGDAEAIGFLPVIKSIKDVHCLCTITEDDEVVLWHDKPELDNEKVWDAIDKKEYTIPPRAGTLIEGFRYWYRIGQSGGTLSVHNAATYDKHLIEKVVPKCIIPDEVWRDTFIQSKVQFFDRSCPKGAKSAHGLQAYGIKFGIKKPPITDYTRFDAEILHRVIEDCRIQKKTQEYLDKEAELLKPLGIDFTEALAIEWEYAVNCHKQEERGVLVDRPHMERCVKEWDTITDALAAEIEPLLPPSIKVSTRVTRSEMMESLGFKRIPPDEVHTIKKDGEMVVAAVKPYFKPSTNFHKVDKVNEYSAFNLSYGQSPTFNKKTEFTAWRNENYPKTKPAEWEVEKVVVEKKVLNKNCCEYFGVDPTDTDIIVGPFTRVSFHASKMTQHDQVKGYLIRHAGLKVVEEWNVKKDSDKRIVRAEHDMIVSYPKRAAPENQLHYKVKKGQPIVTSPKVQEGDYPQLKGDIGPKIGNYNTTTHRRRYISNPSDPDEKGLLSYIREDGRIPAGINNFGTSTGRSSHRKIVNLPSESSMWGKEMRLCLIAPEYRVLVGADQASAQLQICSFVTNNMEYYEAVAKGKEFYKDEHGVDIYSGSSAHCINARSFQLITEEEWQEAIANQDPALIAALGLKRKKAKPCAFSVLFGCAPPKLATLLGISVDEAKLKMAAFLSALGLDVVKSWLDWCKAKYPRGNGFYIPSAFGFWIYCKSMHSAVNYLIQSIEGAGQKVAVNHFEREVISRGWEGKVLKVLDMHK